MQRSSHHFTRLLNASKYNNTNKLMVQSYKNFKNV